MVPAFAQHRWVFRREAGLQRIQDLGITNSHELWRRLRLRLWLWLGNLRHQTVTSKLLQYLGHAPSFEVLATPLCDTLAALLVHRHKTLPNLALAACKQNLLKLYIAPTVNLVRV